MSEAVAAVVEQWWTAYGAEAAMYARPVREDKQDFPMSQKVLGWVAVGYTVHVGGVNPSVSPWRAPARATHR